ncbi:MAG: sulfotransferase [Sulfurovaceae bacterium]
MILENKKFSKKEGNFMLPNFMIVGAPKAGTTSLYHYLSRHPEIFMSNPKELNFFSNQEIKEQELYYDNFVINSLERYKDIFAGSIGKKAIGEASVSYLFYPKTPQKIKEVIPDAKIIILLREPISRAYSHYLMDYRLGYVNFSFDDVVFKRKEDKNIDLFYQQYISLGLYYEQVKRYVDTFGKDRVKIYFQDDFKNDPVCILFFMPKNKIVDFLYKSSLRSLIASLLPRSIKEKIIEIAFEQKQKPKMNKQTKEYLYDIYRDDIANLEKLIGVDLNSWKL